MSKVIFETHPRDNATTEKQIETQFRLLKFVKDGHPVEYKFDSSKWIAKSSVSFSVDSVAYRVLEKNKTVTVYTMICINSHDQIYYWGTEKKNIFNT